MSAVALDATAPTRQTGFIAHGPAQLMNHPNGHGGVGDGGYEPPVRASRPAFEVEAERDIERLRLRAAGGRCRMSG